MDTVMQLRLYGDDGSAAAEISGLLTDLDAKLSAVDPDSALYQLNQSGRSADGTVYALLRQVLPISQRCRGAVDPTVYPLVRLWGFPTGEYRVPGEDELARALETVGLDRISLTDELVTLAPGTALDLGAFAKGWAGDLCRTQLEQRGIPAILNLGGNIQTVGTKPDGSDWVVGVANPDAPERYLLTLRLKGSAAVVSSGDYQRFFEENGVRWCHILDPATGMSVRNGLRSVTVVCDSGVTADGLSTALYVMGFEQAVEFWRESTDFEAVFIDEGGTVYVTEGLADRADGSFTVIRR